MKKWSLVLLVVFIFSVALDNTAIAKEKKASTKQRKKAEVVDTSDDSSCYGLGVRYGRCVAMSFKGMKCDPADDIVIPERCRGKEETDRGIRDGAQR